MISIIKADGKAERWQLDAMRTRAAQTGEEIDRAAAAMMCAVVDLRQCENIR